MNVLLRVASIIDAINYRIGRWSSWLVVIMVAIGVWNVIARYVGQFIGVNLASNTYIELQWYLFSVVFFLGAAYVLLEDEHVRVDVLYNRMSPQRRALVNLLGSLLFLIPFCLIVLYVSWRPVSFSWRIMEGSPDPGGLPRYPIKSMIMVCFSLLLLQGISETIKSAAILTGHREAPEAISEAEHVAREAAAARPHGGA